MDAVLVAAIAAKAGGRHVEVTRVCSQRAVSRSTFYRYVKRFEAEGVAGMFPRSRRPHSSPTMIAARVQEQIIRARKELAEDRVDCGARSIVDWLTEHDVTPVPSRATVHRHLLTAGLVLPQPAKRPRRLVTRRFQADAPNRMWQMDGFEVKLADRAVVVVLHILDDHSRLDVGCHVALSENARDVWAAFTRAVDQYGLPAAVLTDNGTAFSGRRRGWSSPLETNARALGIQPICSSPRHPQTCGKVERAHQTARKWLSQRPTPATITELQALLEDYRDWYNQRRRHQGIGGLTPAQAWDLQPRVTVADHPCPEPLAVTYPTVSASGGIGVDTTEIGLGRRHAGRQAVVFRSGDDVTVFIDHRLTRQLRLDRRRRYQPQAT